jgi:hypothetical protein
MGWAKPSPGQSSRDNRLKIFWLQRYSVAAKKLPINFFYHIARGTFGSGPVVLFVRRINPLCP